MAKIFVVMGKSASGKDTIYKTLASDETLNLKEVVSYTTRPIREGETEGTEYHFVTDEVLQELLQADKVIEHRAYHTVHGVWNYFTVNDGQINLRDDNYIIIGTLESFCQIVKYYGGDVVKPIYIEVENGERLTRALSREKKQAVPKYEEMCRRFLADEQDFSEKNIMEAGITQRFENHHFKTCIEKIRAYILGNIK